MKRPSTRLALAALPLTVLISGCASDRAGQQFREGLAQLQGQPVQVVIDQLGPGAGSAAGSSRRLGSLTIGPVPRECAIEVIADSEGRIVEAMMRGSDHDCGLMLLDLREREARYRASPGLREREAQDSDALINELVDARRQLNERDPD